MRRHTDCRRGLLAPNRIGFGDDVAIQGTSDRLGQRSDPPDLPVEPLVIVYVSHGGSSGESLSDTSVDVSPDSV
jgi:hypothetical protein